MLCLEVIFLREHPQHFFFTCLVTLFSEFCSCCCCCSLVTVCGITCCGSSCPILFCFLFFWLISLFESDEESEDSEAGNEEFSVGSISFVLCWLVVFLFFFGLLSFESDESEEFVVTFISGITTFVSML